MELVLDVYKRPYDPLRPVVCMDESPRQLIGETRLSLPCKPGQVQRDDYEYERCGVCNIFMAVEPLAGKRIVRVTERKTKRDWAMFLQEIAKIYEYAEKITLVMDNLNTHTPGSLYETFIPPKAKRLMDRFEFSVFTGMKVPNPGTATASMAAHSSARAEPVADSISSAVFASHPDASARRRTNSFWVMFISFVSL